MVKFNECLAVLMVVTFAFFATAADKAGSSLLESNRVGRVEIVAGRICATRFPFTYRCQRLTKQTKGSSRSESLTINVRRGNVTARYSAKRQGRSVTFELLPGGTCSFKEVTTNKHDGYEELEFRQSNKRIQLNVRFADRDTRVSEKNLWSLLVVHRSLTAKVLVPALHRLNRRWDLHRRSTDVESRLFDIAQSGRRPVPRKRLLDLVNELSDKKFPVRQTAHRKLKSYGQRVVPFLLSLDLESLDREQRMRLHHIRHELIGVESDLTDRVAEWVSESPAVWISLLSRPDPQKRQLARSQLSRLLGRAIDFDPSAEPGVRFAQIEQLRKKYDAGSVASKRRAKLK